LISKCVWNVGNSNEISKINHTASFNGRLIYVGITLYANYRTFNFHELFLKCQITKLNWLSISWSLMVWRRTKMVIYHTDTWIATTSTNGAWITIASVFNPCIFHKVFQYTWDLGNNIRHPHKFHHLDKDHLKDH